MSCGRRMSTIEDLPAQILDTGVDDLPGQILTTLGLHLFNDGRGVAGNWEGVAEELGISSTKELEQIHRHAQVEHVFPGQLMLRDWGRRNGSTVFVLLNALRRQGREDCIDLVIKACQDVHTMQLLVKIEDEHGHSRYESVTTKKEASLASSLENVLSGLTSYRITGPDHKLTWQSPAQHLKGRQLTLKKGETTEESIINAYGIAHISQPMEINSNPSIPVQYLTQDSPQSLNIPVAPHSVSDNYLTSRTMPKIPEAMSSMSTLNDLSKHGHAIKNTVSSQDFHSLASNLHSNLSARVPSQSERQTLLKKASYSLDESSPNCGHMMSITEPKRCPSDFHSFRSASFDGNDTCCLKRCDPLRHSNDNIKYNTVQMRQSPSPTRLNGDKMSTFGVQMRHPMVNTTGRMMNPAEQIRYQTHLKMQQLEQEMHSTDPHLLHPDQKLHSTDKKIHPTDQKTHQPYQKLYSTDQEMHPKDGFHKDDSFEGDYIPITHPIISFTNHLHSTPQIPCSSPKRCQLLVQRVIHDDYINPQSLTGSGGMTKPMPCVKQSIHVSTVKAPQPKPPTKPKPCGLQQRKDGYIDVVESGTKESPVPALGQPVNFDTSAETAKNQVIALPEEAGVPSAPRCVVSRDENGYATFTENSVMEVDQEEGSAGSVTFSLPMADEDGYLSYSDSGSTPVESAMESDGSDSLASSQSMPIMNQQSSDESRECTSASASDSSRQLSDASAPSPCVSRYLGMNRSESLPSGRNSDGLVYARFNHKDEEEDAEYFDMTTQTHLSRNSRANMFRHSSNGEGGGYLDITPTSSTYDYINDNQNKSRALPPRPSPSVPMKRICRRPQPERKLGADVKDACDLDSVPGWCPHESEESIGKTMKHYQQEDGNFIVWWMDRKKRYVVTVSHMNELRHYAVYKQMLGTKVRLCIFQGGYEFDNLKALVEHYMREGLNGPEIQSRGKRWQQFSHVRLRKPLRVKYTHTVVRKPRDSIK